MDEPKPEPVQEPQPPRNELPPLTPRELRASYLKRSVVVLVLLAWFVHDGWFNPDIHSKAFNKLGSVLLAWGFVYCIVMAVKSHLAMKRQPTAGNQNPAPPGTGSA